MTILLPINLGAASFATSNNCKQLMVMNNTFFPTTGKGISQEGNGFVNRCMLLCKYSTYNCFGCITLNLEWFGKVWQSKNRIVA